MLVCRPLNKSGERLTDSITHKFTYIQQRWSIRWWLRKRQLYRALYDLIQYGQPVVVSILQNEKKKELFYPKALVERWSWFIDKALGRINTPDAFVVKHLPHTLVAVMDGVLVERSIIAERAVEILTTDGRGSLRA